MLQRTSLRRLRFSMLRITVARLSSNFPQRPLNLICTTTIDHYPGALHIMAARYGSAG